MKKILFVIIFTLFITSCSSNDSSESIIEGDFSGTFSRVQGNARYATAEVSITFSNGTFEGVSNINDYPAICNGTFEIVKDEIIFSNDCAFTADFDWTYILDGTFDYQLNGSELRISKVYNSTSSDTYILSDAN
tara:strand:- start:16220 stop:16621 length:402 start_codon:yes stop_codon:yes gene_type:complete